MSDNPGSSSKPGELPSSDVEDRCVICKSPIFKDARKCIECGSYQNLFYRFFVGFDVKSIVALIPIATLAFVFVKDQINNPQADLKIASLECAGDTITLAAANLGDRDALFAGVDLIQAESPAIRMSLGEISNTELLVKASKTNIYKVEARDNLGTSLGLRLENQSACHYRLKIRAIDFEQSVGALKSICACPEK